MRKMRKENALKKMWQKFYVVQDPSDEARFKGAKSRKGAGEFPGL